MNTINYDISRIKTAYFSGKFQALFQKRDILPYLCKTGADSLQFYNYFCHQWIIVWRSMPMNYDLFTGVCHAFLLVRRACQPENHASEQVR